MKLLIITQKVDLQDDNLGFFHGWVKEFAKHASEVRVIASYVGKTDLPANVQVFSLGKESRQGRLRRWCNFWHILASQYVRSDIVFFHMIPEFVLAAFPFLFFSKKKRALWYTHKSVTWKLRLAEKLVDKIFTASSLSFRLPSRKIVYTGHGIDTDFFRPERLVREKSGILKIISAGRISMVKDYEVVLRACFILKRRGTNFNYSMAGTPVMAGDREYLLSLQDLTEKLNLTRKISFMGPVSYTSMPAVYNEHDIFISTSVTGSIDKAVLEAMSCGLTVITSNEAFKDILPAKYFLSDKNPEKLADKIFELSSEPEPNHLLRSLVVNNHSLGNTIKTICNLLD